MSEDEDNTRSGLLFFSNLVTKKKTLAEQNREQCKVRAEKGDMWCAEECPDTYTCPNSAK